MSYFCDTHIQSRQDQEARFFIVLEQEQQLTKEILQKNSQYREFCQKYRPKMVLVDFIVYSTDVDINAAMQDEDFDKLIADGQTERIAQSELKMEPSKERASGSRKRRKRSPVMIAVAVGCILVVVVGAFGAGKKLGSLTGGSEVTETVKANEDGMIIPEQEPVVADAEQITVSIDRSYAAVPTEDLQLKGAVVDGKAQITLPVFDKEDFFTHVPGYTWGFSSSPDGEKIEYYGGQTYSFTKDTKLYRVLVKYGGGSGTKDDPYRIDYYDQLELMGEEKARGYFLQTADIVFPDWVTHKPIDTVNELKSDPDAEYFEYDGGGYAIKNLTDSLFGKISGAVIQNVNIRDSFIHTEEYRDCGFIACAVYNYRYETEDGKRYETGEAVNPPKLYDLTTLQRECNKYYGYTAKQTLDALQSLYEAKLATYPRTDSQYLPEDMEQTALQVISVIGSVYPEFQSSAPDVRRCINNKKVTGHHAIIPTASIRDADITKLPEIQQKVLLLLAAKLVMAASIPQKYESTKVTVRCEGTDFKASGRTVLDEGWKAIESRFKARLKNKESDDEKDPPEQKLPELTQGQTFQQVSGELHEHWTTPPKPYTEDTLLTAMEHAGQDDYDEESEKKGLGTPATRAAVIEGLVNHGYIERKKKQIISTERGRSLIAVVPNEVKSPKLTAEWEMQLQQIENGKAYAADFMQQIIAYVKQICATYSTADESVSFQSEQAVIGKCPKCGGEVKNGKYGFYCTKKCGMNLAKVYGKVLTEAQLGKLLSGKQISYTANGKKTIVLPEIEQNDYNGKTYFQWKTKRDS